MHDIGPNTPPSQSDECGKPANDYLARAVAARAAGNESLGLLLYLTAFERACAGKDGVPDANAITGLREAWRLACASGERSLAEYAFERLEPYLSAEEAEECAAQLQDLALSKLEEFGIHREDLQEMGELVSGPAPSEASSAPVPTPGIPGVTGIAVASVSEDGALSLHDLVGSMIGEMRQSAPRSAEEDDAEGEPPLSYKNLVGYDQAVRLMRDFGVGLGNDVEFRRFVKQLNASHGLGSAPAIDSFLFRSPAREDAQRFMMATLGELGLPCVRMNMEENVQGVPMLCVSAMTRRPGKFNPARMLEGPCVLMLEDLDEWVSPASDAPVEDFGGFLMATLSHGAREALNLIQMAVDNPDVYVLASASDACEIEPFFYDMLEPLTVVDIGVPTEQERAEIWDELVRDHPSLGAIDAKEVVRLTASLPRYDIYMATREAVEQSYREGLVSRSYRPVDAGNLFDKIAAYQPLESKEYGELEQAVLEGFRADIDAIEALMAEEEGCAEGPSPANASPAVSADGAGDSSPAQ
ncbi:ribonucleotide reductase subunit alpha [Adlercreutzia aquisgranensis]|uniref:ribonucleotide reductase subunit alpha n=1 Tax=Adlercreutzia aquisgranensis TaxID=2941323 RepID=UPI002041363B|nr:ribonucleotide reductase subunit alpha [Adlercreutzia aquisgranensis]